MAHLLRGNAERSKRVRTTRARRVDVKLERPVPYELDGGARPDTQRLEARIHPGAITVAVPGEPIAPSKPTTKGRRR
jgi:diacylglycerol kinase family enzyme